MPSHPEGAAAAPSPFRIEQAMSTLMQARDALLQADPELVEDEAELLRLLEGGDEGRDALAILRRLVRAAILAGNRAEAVAEMQARLEARHDRYSRREESLRDAVLAALQALDIKRLEEADFTVFRRAGPPRVVITDEAQLPDDFVRVTREPNKLALRETLIEGEIIDGAMLGNGADVLTIKSI